jgi:hypothetical protein
LDGEFFSISALKAELTGLQLVQRMMDGITVLALRITSFDLMFPSLNFPRLPGTVPKCKTLPNVSRIERIRIGTVDKTQFAEALQLP